MPDETLWELGDHTPGKHLVLREYLNAWMPILGITQSKIVFIDGFAGPGEYAEGQPGSPLIALEALRQHTALERFRARVVFYFVEKDADRADHLRSVLARPENVLPQNAEAHVETGAFDDTMLRALDGLESRGLQLAPVFLMVDPFGVSNTPMAVLERVLRHDKAEVYISFMYEWISRFAGTSEFAPHLDERVGTDTWRDGLELATTEARRHFFHSLYRDQLKVAGASYVVNFSLYSGRRFVYSIFFATKHVKGCDRMKQAIWKIAPFGDYSFRGGSFSESILDFFSADLTPFKHEILGLIATNGPQTIESLQEFSGSDLTLYHSGKLKAALRELEAEGDIRASRDGPRRRGQFPEGTVIRLANSENSD